MRTLAEAWVLACTEAYKATNDGWHGNLWPGSLFVDEVVAKEPRPVTLWMAMLIALGVKENGVYTDV